jgi:hypothetical protein
MVILNGELISDAWTIPVSAGRMAHAKRRSERFITRTIRTVNM